jgi:hypothetical protein
MVVWARPTINGIDLAPAAKAVENGKKIIAYRTEETVKEIQPMMTATKTSQ